MAIEKEELPAPLGIAPFPPPVGDEKIPATPRRRREIRRWGFGKRIEDGRNMNVYGRDALHPARHARVVAGGRLRRWKIATVRFDPVRYNPVRKTAVLARAATLRLTFRRLPAQALADSRRLLLEETVLDGLAADLLLNLDRARAWYAAAGARADMGVTKSLVSGAGLAVVTTERTWDESTRLADYVLHKQELGYSVVVVTESATRTVTGSPGRWTVSEAAGGFEDVVGDDPPHGRPQKIRRWLQDHYLDPGFEFVLLIGDPDPDNPEDGDRVGDLPMPLIWRERVEGHPSDLYYSDLSGDWNLDDDEYTGEADDSTGYSDLAPGLPPESFSVRWEGVVEVSGLVGASTVRLDGYSDGQTAIWLDVERDGFDAGDLLLEDASEHLPTYFAARATVPGADRYPVRIEYRQSSGDACFEFSHESGSGGTTRLQHETAPDTFHWGLWGRYFAGDAFAEPAVDELAENYPSVCHVASGDRGVGGVDFYPEVLVGRIPVYDEDGDGAADATILDAILDKLMAYESSSGRREQWRRGVLCSTPWMYDLDGAPGYDTADYESCEVLRDEVATPPFWDWYRIHDEDYGVGAEVVDGCSLDRTLDGWNDPADSDDGRGVVIWNTHGWQTGALNVFDQDLCIELDDTRPSIVLQVSCSNGRPEVLADGNYPLAYSLVKQGAAAAVAATREVAAGRFDPADPSPCTRPLMGNVAYCLGRGVLGNLRLGEVVAAVRSGDATLGGAWGDRLSYNLYGDPTLSLFGSGVSGENDLVVLLDGSGSMLREGKWQAAVDASALLVSLLGALADPAYEDRYGVVVFRCTGAGEDCVPLPGGLRPVSEHLAPDDLEALAPVAAYLTPIGPGLESAVGELDLASRATPFVSRSIVLLSDGKHNCGVDPLDVELPEDVTVHAVGLGSDAIEPETIRDLAAATGGSYRLAPTPSDLADFFIQLAVDLSWKLQDVPVDGDRVPVDEPTAAFFALWDDPASTVSFALDPPGDGPFVSPSSLDAYPPMECEFHAPAAGERHAYYVCEGIPSELLGEWRFAELLEDGTRVAPEDLRLKTVVDPRVVAEYAIAAGDHRTGDPLVLTAVVTRDGRPLTGLARVWAEPVRIPGEDLGSAMRRTRRLPGTHAELRRRGTGTAKILPGGTIGHLLKDAPRFPDPATRMAESIALRDDGRGFDARPGDGVYTGAFLATKYEGTYTFEFRAQGKLDGRKFARGTTRSEYVKFEADPTTSRFEVVATAVDPKSQLSRTSIRVAPRGRSGGSLGPGRGHRIRIRPAAGTAGALHDLGDGSYRVEILHPSGPPPRVTITVDDVVVADRARLRRATSDPTR